MTPKQVREARQTLGLQQAELAQALRLGDNGRVTVGRWEKDNGPSPISGPASLALDYLMQGSLDDAMKSVLSEHAFAEGENDVELVYRNWRPRFIAAVTPEKSSAAAINTAPGEWLSVAMWIDDPNSPPGWDVDVLLKRAATAWEIYNQVAAEASA